MSPHLKYLCPPHSWKQIPGDKCWSKSQVSAITKLQHGGFSWKSQRMTQCPHVILVSHLRWIPPSGCLESNCHTKICTGLKERPKKHKSRIKEVADISVPETFSLFLGQKVKNWPGLLRIRCFLDQCWSSVIHFQQLWQAATDGVIPSHRCVVGSRFSRRGGQENWTDISKGLGPAHSLTKSRSEPACWGNFKRWTRW